MDTEKIKALLQAIEDGNLSSAAKKLGYTPSGMSRMMVALEDELGMRLLDRDRHGVHPTRNLEAILPQMKELVRVNQNLVEQVASLSGAITGQVNVATAYNVLFRPLARIVRDFNESYPGISVHLEEGISSDIMRSVEAHNIDFGIISKRDGSCDWETLVKDEFNAWVPKNHLATDVGYYSMDNLKADPLIELFPGSESDMSIVLEKNGISPNFRYSTSDTYAAYSMVAAGLGITMSNALFNNMWQDDVVAVPLKPSVVIDIGVVTPNDTIISPAAKLFKDYALPRLKEAMQK